MVEAAEPKGAAGAEGIPEESKQPKPEPSPELAEVKKNEGNEMLKAGKIAGAIALYTEAIEMFKSEGMFTNRAMAYIKQRKYKEALFDCEQALYINP